MKTLLTFFADMSDLLADYSKDSVFPSVDLSIPALLVPEARKALADAAARDDRDPESPGYVADDFAPHGKWHRAAQSAQFIIENEARKLDKWVCLGDWSHRALMKVAAREFGE